MDGVYENGTELGRHAWRQHTANTRNERNKFHMLGQAWSARTVRGARSQPVISELRSLFSRKKLIWRLCDHGVSCERHKRRMKLVQVTDDKAGVGIYLVVFHFARNYFPFYDTLTSERSPVVYVLQVFDAVQRHIELFERNQVPRL